MPAVVEAKGALAFWRNLHPVLAAKRHLLRPTGHVAFEMEGSGDGIGLRLWVSAGISAHAVARAVSSAWPGAQCHVRDAHRAKLAGRLTSCGELRLAAPAWLPLGTDHVVDPLRTVIGVLGSWKDDEQGLVQVLVRPAGSRSTRMLARAARSLQTGRPSALVPRLLAAWRGAPARPAVPDPMRAATCALRSTRRVTCRHSRSPSATGSPVPSPAAAHGVTCVPVPTSSPPPLVSMPGATTSRQRTARVLAGDSSDASSAVARSSASPRSQPLRILPTTR